MCGLVQILNFKSIECGKVQSNQIGLSIIYLVYQTLTCSLTTIGRFKFMDNNAILIKL